MITMRTSLLYLRNFQNLERENLDIILTSLQCYWNEPQTLWKFTFCVQFWGKKVVISWPKFTHFPEIFLPIVFPGPNDFWHVFSPKKNFLVFFLFTMVLVHSGKPEFPRQFCNNFAFICSFESQKFKKIKIKRSYYGSWAIIVYSKKQHG